MTLDDIVRFIPPLDAEAGAGARVRQDQLTKPRGSLGALETLSVGLAGMTGQSRPRLERRVVIVMAADHGVAAEGVSAYPQAVTAQMVLNFLSGGAGINVLSRLAGARVVVVDMGVATTLPDAVGLVSRRVAAGTRSMARGPAMSRRQAELAVRYGIEVLKTEADRGLDIIATGDMGIANTTAATAICAAITGRSAAQVTGRGTGIDDEGLLRKQRVVERALELNRPDPCDALDVLAKVGGFEIGGLAGVMMGAAARRVPVVLDGVVSGAAALIAVGIAPGVKHYLIAGHLSAEPGHEAMLEHLGLSPMLRLDMRLGEGTGAALAMLLCEAAVRTLNEMATFTEAGVSDKADRPG